MIATFRNESRRAAWFGAVVALLALVSLTDATAGEHKIFTRMLTSLTPEAKAVMERLDGNMTLELKDASIETVVNTVTNRTGVNLSFAPDALTDEAREARVTLKAANVPAHVVLLEALSSVNLGLDFQSDGASIVKMPEEEVELAEVPTQRIIGEDRVIIRDGDPVGVGELPAGAAKRRFFVKKIDIADEIGSGKDGVMRRHVKLKSHDGSEGTLELEVRR